MSKDAWVISCYGAIAAFVIFWIYVVEPRQKWRASRPSKPKPYLKPKPYVPYKRPRKKWGIGSFLLGLLAITAEEVIKDRMRKRRPW